jgi:hypothetical protein
MSMQIDKETLARLLRQNDMNLTKVGYDLGVSTQRVYQLCKLVGIKITKDIEFVKPEAPSLQKKASK